MNNPERTISDAIVDALLRMYPGIIKPGGGTKAPILPPPPKAEKPYLAKKQYPRPQGVIAPPGVIWKAASGRWSVQVSIRHRMHFVCNCQPTQAGADEAGRLFQFARALRDRGAGIEEIRAAVRERMAA